jgi:hydroxymethylglutaryl-CoA lyase
LSTKHGKKLVIYISMGFGNPYNEPWDVDIVMAWCYRLKREYNASIISLSDTIGSSDPKSIRYLFSNLVPEMPKVEIGAHLHTTPDTWKEKVHAAYNSGCTRYDGALKGFGGCPMAADDLTGNMATENIISYLQEHEELGIKKEPLSSAMKTALEIFPV